MNKTILLVGGVAVLAYNHINGIIKAFQASTIRVVTGKLVKMQSIEQSYIIIRLQVTNPTNTTYSVGTFKASLTYQGQLIAVSNYTGNDTVRPGITFIDVPCAIQNITAAQSVVNIIKQLIGGNFDQSVTITGTFSKYGYSVPVNETFKLKDFF